jgi:hypothetical protein
MFMFTTLAFKGQRKNWAAQNFIFKSNAGLKKEVYLYISECDLHSSHSSGKGGTNGSTSKYFPLISKERGLIIVHAGGENKCSVSVHI